MNNILDKLKRATTRIIGSPAQTEPREPSQRVLFVCMGNICRSPTAEGVFRKVLQERAPQLYVEVDSAGTHAYHVGEAPDPRACRAALQRGVDLTKQRARQVTEADFERFDLVLAMDPLNRAYLRELSPPEQHGRIRLFLEFAPHLGRDDVPDPYYGGTNGFEYVLDLSEQASIGLIEHLQRTTRAAPNAQRPPA